METSPVNLRRVTSFDTLSDPAAEILQAKPASLLVKVVEGSDSYDVTWGEQLKLTFTKSPLQFSMHDGSSILWEEAQPISWNSSTTYQTLKSTESEYVFGGGMQNGRFSHKHHAIRISKDFNWADGGNPSSAPFYLVFAYFGD